MSQKNSLNQSPKPVSKELTGKTGGRPRAGLFFHNSAYGRHMAVVAAIQTTMPRASENTLAERLNEVLQTQRVTDDGSAARDHYKLSRDLTGEIEAWPSHAERKRLNTAIERIQLSNKNARIETAVRLAYATNWLLSGFISVRKDSLSFSEFKAALRPEQAERMATKTMQMGVKARMKAAELNDGPDKPYLTELAFYLVAVSLYAKAGVDWIDSDIEERIDSLIAKSVLFLEKVRARMPSNPR